MARKARNVKRPKRRGKKKVFSFPKQLQCANTIPSNRLIKFSDFRSFILTDNNVVETSPGSGIYKAAIPNLQCGANDPTRAFIGSSGFIGSTGSWYSQSANPGTGVISKGYAVPNIPQWLTNQDGSGNGMYRTGQVLGSRITVSCVPLPSSISSQVQDVSKLCLQVSTLGDTYKDQLVSDNFNSEKISQLSGMKTANIYSNDGGTPRGASLSCNYSYKKSNATMGRMANNTFQVNASPGEKDFFNILLLPCENARYGTGASSTLPGTGRMPKMRVSVRISYICLLSEANNTTIGLGDNKGTDLSGTAHVQSSAPLEYVQKTYV